MNKFLVILVSLAVMQVFTHVSACEDDPLFKIKTGAENGDPKSEYEYGMAFRLGQGVKQDITKALEWWHKAAEKNNASAQISIGNAYSEGRGVKQDMNEALRWYAKASGNGSGHAKHLIASYYDSYNVRNGWIYEAGHAQAKKLREEAFKPLQMSALTGDSESQLALGNAFHNGWGVAKNDAEAVRWYRKAVEQCNHQAETALGMAYKNGEGIAKDDAKAVELFTKAAEEGISVAQYMLASAYITGQGTGQDLQKGYMWLNLAGLDGIQQAFKERDIIAPKMRSDQIVEANRMTNDWVIRNSTEP